MSCFTEVDDTKNFYAFRVRSPTLFKKKAIPQKTPTGTIMVDFVTPPWARHVAESVVPGAYVTMGILKSGKWATQSIEVPLAGRATREARQLAMRIAAKLKACPEAAAMNREKACADLSSEKGEEDPPGIFASKEEKREWKEKEARALSELGHRRLVEESHGQDW